MTLGLSVHSGVRKETGLLVAEDIQSRSGKAKKAARYNIPVLSAAQFAALRPGDSVAVVATSEELADRKVIICPMCHVTWTVPGTSSEQRSKPCADCSRARRHPPNTPAKTRTDLVFETLACNVCGGTWDRKRTRGRKPRICPSCSSAS